MSFDVETDIEHKLCFDVAWQLDHEPQVWSAVNHLQTHYDKSQISSSTNPYAFYPLHDTPLNLPKDMKKKQNVSSSRIDTYLQVSSWKHKIGPFWNRNRAQNITSSYYCFNHALISIANCEIRTILCFKSYGNVIILHTITASFVADGPKF